MSKSNGATLTAPEFNAVTIHKKSFSDATARTSTSNSWADSGTAFTFSPAGGEAAIILGIVFYCRMKHIDPGYAEVNLEFDGTNLGTYYLRRRDLSDSGLGYSDIFLDPTENSAFDENSGVLQIKKVHQALYLPVKDSSTTITVRLRTDTGGNTAHVQDVELDVIYADNFIDEDA